MPNRVLNRIDTRVAYLEQINRVYDYYKHATLGDTAKKFGKTKTQIKIWIRKIEKDHSNNKLRGSSLRAHTTKKKKEIIFYARRYGYSATMSKFFVPKYKIIIWAQQYRNGCLGWEPDKKVFKMLKDKTIQKNRSRTIVFCNRIELIRNLKMEDMLYGSYKNWTSIKMRYAIINELRRTRKITIDNLCLIAEVSKRGFYNWLANGRQEFNAWDDDVARKIKNLRKRNKNFIGARQIRYKFIKKYKKDISRYKVNRYLNDLKLDTRLRHSANASKSRSLGKDMLPHVKNSLFKNGKPNFSVKSKNEKWICDFTLVYQADTKDEQYYLFFVEDLYGRMIIDFDFWKFKDCSDGVLNLMPKLLQQERPKIFHSDGGREFKNWEFNHLLELYGVKQSISAPAKPIFTTLFLFSW